MTRITDNVILMCAKLIDITDMNFWVCDSGALCHVTSSIKFTYDLKDVHQEIEVADGNKVECHQVGKLDLEYEDKQGKTIRTTLTNVKFIPEMKCNLFSVLNVVDKEFTINGNKNDGMTLQRGNIKFCFNIFVNTGNGRLVGATLTSTT